MPSLPSTVNPAGVFPGLDYARGLLLLILVGSPLIFGSVQSWAWACLAVMAGCLLILWGVDRVQQNEFALFWSPLYLPALAFLLLGGVQLARHLTLDPMGTREALLKLTTDFVLFFLAAQLAATASRRAWRQFGLLGTLFGFALAVFSILQFLSSQGLIYWSVKTEGWAFGPYVNHNHYAGLMEMLIPISAAYVFSRPRNGPGREMLLFAASVPIVSLLLSGSRGGMISLLAEVAVFLAVLGWRGSPRWRELSRIGPLVVLTALLLFFWLDPGEISSRLATVVKRGQSSDIDLRQRQAVALDSLRMLQGHPWAGTGLGSFEIAYAEYRSFPSDFVWDHAHNDYVEALVESGVLGGTLIFVALAMFFRFSFAGLAGRIRDEVGEIQMGAALGCLGLLVHSAFDFNLHIPANAAWFAVCAASASTAVRRFGQTAGTTVLAWHNDRQASRRVAISHPERVSHA